MITYKKTDNTYSGNSDCRSDIDNVLITPFVQFNGETGKFSYQMRLLGRFNRIFQTDGETYNRYEISPSFFAAYAPQDNCWLSYKIWYKPYRPALSDISRVSQDIDYLQVRRGNPSLKTGNGIDQTLKGYLFVNPVSITLTFNYLYTDKFITEETFIDNGKFVRMPRNMKWNHSFYNECEVSSSFFDDVLNLSGVVGFNRFINVGDTYRHYYGKWYSRVTATLSLGGWMLNTTCWNHNNDFFGEILSTSGRAITFTLMKTWLDGNLSTTLSLYNPFSSYTKQGVVNYSGVAPYSNWMHKNQLHRALTFGISYRFNSGRKPLTETSTTTTFKGETGVVNNGKSAEKAKK